MSKNSFNELGAGIYTIPDIALILGLPPGKVRRWMRDYWDSVIALKINKENYTGLGRDRTTNFSTLIEFYVFYQLRELRLSTKNILKAYESISKRLKTNYPFANAQILANPKDIFFSLDDNVMVNAISNQTSYKELIEIFCKKIEFSEAKVAAKFYPIGKSKRVIVDPEHQFGQPILKDTNILTENIYSMYKSNETINTISILFEVSLEEINDVISFYEPKAA